ncbi:hypothetical protein TNCV_917641 [Trichonephila clavipes]|nr:hypothetical protein TNCV_917641 [Trichonephila clavipes]
MSSRGRPSRREVSPVEVVPLATRFPNHVYLAVLKIPQALTARISVDVRTMWFSGSPGLIVAAFARGKILGGPTAVLGAKNFSPKSAKLKVFKKASMTKNSWEAHASTGDEMGVSQR